MKELLRFALLLVAIALLITAVFIVTDPDPGPRNPDGEEQCSGRLGWCW